MTPEERTSRALTDILDFADEISQYVTSLGEQSFYSHRPTQLIAEALLHRIGEAVSRLEDGFVAEHPAVEWEKMKGMRNVVAHEYGFIDYRIVWRALSDVLPDDVAAIELILEQGRGERLACVLASNPRDVSGTSRPAQG